jgi:adenine-specific DNA-methyltransferase
MQAALHASDNHRQRWGQFLTPPEVAGLMASLSDVQHRDVDLLDPGAGSGALTAAWVAHALNSKHVPQSIACTLYELDESILPTLTATMGLCAQACEAAEVSFTADVRVQDFLSAGAAAIRRQTDWTGSYNVVITNPPYKKLQVASPTARLLASAGVSHGNLYTAFISLAVAMLRGNGELIAITPRSFMNGPYFERFRRTFFHSMTLTHLHVFGSRTAAFADDGVLQENVIFRATKSSDRNQPVIVSTSERPGSDVVYSVTTHDSVVPSTDPSAVIHLATDGHDESARRAMGQMSSSLRDLGIGVSTGRVVDFRVADALSSEHVSGSVPLIYPAHLRSGDVEWPKPFGRKPNALRLTRATRPLLVPEGFYVLVKRFSAKEEPRRIVASIYDPTSVAPGPVAFENHLNYFHAQGVGLPETLAVGLAAYLNTTMVDDYFRLFSGHTQVNATDLKSLRYPSIAQLMALGTSCRAERPATQQALDAMIGREVGGMVEYEQSLEAKERISDAQVILGALGLPKAQLNERSALALLALVDVLPTTTWAEASRPLLGITPMMDFFKEHYGKQYAPNTRETVRRQSVHQFLAAGMLVQNPDDPRRPTNSGRTVYQATDELVRLVRVYGTEAWTTALQSYLVSAPSLVKKYARERLISRVPVKTPGGEAFTLSPGGQNPLVAAILEDFCGVFTPGANVLYVGDTQEKFAFFDQLALRALGVELEPHGKMPDVVVHATEQGWLVLVEAVTSHGPIGPKRRDELVSLFGMATEKLVFVTAFVDRKTMTRHIDDIAWESEVWIAESPTHLIHFDGEQFVSAE